MIAIMSYMPRGVFDTFIEYLHRRRMARLDAGSQGARKGVA
jgi:hypothetical protein